MCTFGPGTEVVDVKLVIVSREWTQATPWGFLWALPIPFILVNSNDGFATRVWVTCAHVFADG